MPAEDVAEHAQLQTSVGVDQAMLEERWTFGYDLQPQRILQVLFDHPRDPVRHRRRREDGLRRVGEAEDPLDVEREPRVQHLVGLVEDEVFDAAERDQLLLDHVQDPSWGADHDVGTALQALHLLVIADAAVEQRAAESGIQ